MMKNIKYDYENIKDYPEDQKSTTINGIILTKDGRAWNPFTEKWLTVGSDNRCGVRIGNALIRFSLHHAIANAWLPNPEYKRFILFKDDDKSNCRLDNLFRSHFRINVIGKQINYWTILQDLRDGYALCRCDCGTIKKVAFGEVHCGGTKSCGCMRMKLIVDAITTHGFAGNKSKTRRLYDILRGMHVRCYNPKAILYENYGGRGISICDEWNKEVIGVANAIKNFINWARANGYRSDLSIDRIDNDGNYEPSNCRWATMKTQRRNTRRNVYVKYKDKSMCIADWADYLNIPRTTMQSKLSRGLSIGEIIDGV